VNHLTRGVAVLCAASMIATGCSHAARFRQRFAPAQTTVDPVELSDAVRPNIEPGSAGKLQEPHARVHWRSIGRSVERREIEAVEFGGGVRRVLLIGGIHGDEPEGQVLVERVADEFAVGSRQAPHATVFIIRDLNPDGTAAGTRGNSRGVDLNRNFPAANWQATARRPEFNPGPRPGSEPETQTLLGVLDGFQPDRIIVMHATRGKPMVNYDGPAQSLAELMSRHSGYVVSDTIGYPTPGSLGSYAGKDLEIPIITLELPRGIDAETCWATHRDSLGAALQ